MGLLAVAGAAEARPGSVVFNPRVLDPVARFACDTAGNRCCEPDDEVPTVHCQGLLGCNLETGRCEPCGEPSQVCCDGPYTSFSLRSYTGPLLDPGQRVTSCDPGASCDARLAPDGQGWVGSRRCVGCGRWAGAACCPPDLRYALGRCSEAFLDGRRLVCDDPWAGAAGKCVRCGQQVGDPACMTEGEPACDRGLVEHHGLCVFCGNPGQPPCDDGCDEYSAVLGRDGFCVAAGGPWQPCRRGLRSPCSYRGTFCNAAKICEACGNLGQRCCPDGSPCWNSFCQPAPGGDRCTGCGFIGSRVCASGDPCPTGGTVIAGWCRPCGKPGQACCRGETIVCEAPGRCRDGECRVPASGGGGGNSGWRTCGGNPYTFSTRTFEIWVEGGDQCLAAGGFVANDEAEARACARAAYGGAVVDAPLQIVRGVDCPASGCRDTTLIGRDEEGAVGCGEATFWGCEVLAGRCP